MLVFIYFNSVPNQCTRKNLANSQKEGRVFVVNVEELTLEFKKLIQYKIFYCDKSCFNYKRKTN